MAAESSKFIGYAVIAPPQNAASSSKFIGYAVTSPLGAQASKFIGYSVIGPKGAQASKFIGYAVIWPSGNTTWTPTGTGSFNAQPIPVIETPKIDMYVATGSPGQILTSKFDMYVAIGPPGPPPLPPRVIARMAIYKKPGT